MTLLAALLAEREGKVTEPGRPADRARIGARAERKVTEELINAFRRVTHQENILFAIAESSQARVTPGTARQTALARPELVIMMFP